MALAWESLAELRKRRLNHKVDLEVDDNLTRPVCELSTSLRLVMFAVKAATATIRRTLVTLQFSIRPSPARLLGGVRRTCPKCGLSLLLLGSIFSTSETTTSDLNKNSLSTC